MREGRFGRLASGASAIPDDPLVLKVSALLAGSGPIAPPQHGEHEPNAKMPQSRKSARATIAGDYASPETPRKPSSKCLDSSKKYADIALK